MAIMLKIAVLFMVAAFSSAQAETQNKITALSVLKTGSDTIIQVQLAEPLTKPPAGVSINLPPSIALDFPNTASALDKSLQNFSSGDLRSANILQAGSRTRLVVNLNKMMAYETSIRDKTVLITLHTSPPELPVASAQFAQVRQSSQKYSLNSIDFHRGKNGEGRIQVDLSNPGIGIDTHRQGTQLIVDFMQTSLPVKLQRKLNVTDFATPVQIVDTFTQGDNVRMVIEPKGIWEQIAYQTDNKFILEIKADSEDPNKLVKAGYTGEKLTLNFQDITVREALNVIADFTQLNMVISDTVTGNLTLRLKDVPWDQALDIILQSRGLAMRKNGNVIQVAPTGELATSEKNELTSRQDISELEELQTESFQLGYTTAVAAAALLNGVAGAAAPGATPGATTVSTRILSKRGSAMADIRTNTLFIKDTPSRLDEVRKLLKQIDVPVRQVMIEARFVSVGDNFARTLGGKLGYSGPAVSSGAGFALGANTPTATRAIVTGLPNVNLPSPANGTGGAGLLLSLFNPSATKVLSLELDAAESDGVSKNIGSPKVVTADRAKAIIQQGVQIPYTIAATGSLPASTAFVSANLSLEVTPHITPDNNVHMTLDANQDTVGTLLGGQTIPSINTKKISTEVLVQNGGTVVVGGVFTQDSGDTFQKVPLLGDIPGLGWLFKNNSKTNSKSELLIFITPKIMQDSINLR